MNIFSVSLPEIASRKKWVEAASGKSKWKIAQHIPDDIPVLMHVDCWWRTSLSFSFAKRIKGIGHKKVKLLFFVKMKAPSGKNPRENYSAWLQFGLDSHHSLWFPAKIAIKIIIYSHFTFIIKSRLYHFEKVRIQSRPLCAEKELNRDMNF